MDAKAFDQWFEQRFGWSALGIGKPNYDLYREFFNTRGEVDYLRFLCHLLKLGDDVINAVREDRKSHGKKAGLINQ